MMRKKLIAGILAVALCLSLASCGSSKSKEENPADTPNTPPAEEQVKEPDFVLDLSSLTVLDIGPIDTGNLKLNTGELLSVNYGGDGVVVVKAKINPLSNNKQTINQNYYNVCYLIRDNGFDACQELQYWAVADMTSGDETKVISFTVERATIEGVVNGNVVDNQLGQYVSELYIHPSLLT